MDVNYVYCRLKESISDKYNDLFFYGSYPKKYFNIPTFPINTLTPSQSRPHFLYKINAITIYKVLSHHLNT